LYFGSIIDTDFLSFEDTCKLYKCSIELCLPEDLPRLALQRIVSELNDVSLPTVLSMGYDLNQENLLQYCIRYMKNDPMKHFFDPVFQQILFKREKLNAMLKDRLLFP
jgi:hypothetical protein